MKKKISRRARLTYFGLLLCLGVLMVVGPAMGGSIQFTSVSVSQSFGSMYMVNPGPNFVAVNGNPASVAITNTTITCLSTSVACGQETLTLFALVTGLLPGDLFSIGLDGTWSGGAATSLSWSVTGLGATLTVSGPASSAFNFTLGPFSLTVPPDPANLTGTFTINGLGAGQSIVLSSSAIANLSTPGGVPEPTSVALMGTGFLAMGIGAWRRRRRQK